jgi:hypothetical protein
MNGCCLERSDGLMVGVQKMEAAKAVGCDGACFAFDAIVLAEKRDLSHFQLMKDFTSAVNTTLTFCSVRTLCLIP